MLTVGSLGNTVQVIPKAEQHVHIEAAVTTTLARVLAKRNNIELSSTIFADENTFACHNFHEFHHIYDVVASVIRTQQDYFDIVYDYLKRSAKENCFYTEITLSPDHARTNKISYDDMLNGAIAAMEQAKKYFGIESRIIMTLVRHTGVKKMENVARCVADNLHPLITGIGMAGDETIGKVKDFQKAFAIAHNAGLHCTAHAGEVTDAKAIWDSINYLPIQRIGHGTLCLSDPALVETLIDRKISLEVCPTSNLFTGVYASYADHPLLKLQEAGLTITLNSDDPTFFSTSIGNEYQIAHDQFCLTIKQLRRITEDAIKTGFIDEGSKQRLLDKVQQANNE
jgi:adenosine deaminase